MSSGEILIACGVVAGGIIAYCAFLIFVGLRLNKLGIVAAVIATIAILVALFVGLGIGPSPPMLLFLMLVFGWMLYAFVRYQQVRQDELLQIIATAVEAKLPLGPSIRAYLADRPAEGRSADWVAALFLLFPPGFLLWSQRLRFDRKAGELAHLLDHGVALADAYRITGSVASQEIKVAASVGETTGRLAECLRKADRDRLAGAWLEILPRVLYPLLVLLFVFGISTFMAVAIAPRFQRIFADFGYPMPSITRHLFTVWNELSLIGPFLAMVVPAILLWCIAMMFSPTIRWYLPFIGRLYRSEAQGLVLRMLGALVETGQTVPRALSILADTEDFPYVVKRCLVSAREATERGEPLAEALRGAGLLPATMVPLVQAAERGRTLPWALAELGGHLAGRAVARARRLSFVATPAMVVAVGALVGFIAIGMFAPLIDLLGRLSV
ncbi:MAG: type II secretion system F family protein [Gemmataceae bacterium]